MATASTVATLRDFASDHETTARLRTEQMRPKRIGDRSNHPLIAARARCATIVREALDGRTKQLAIAIALGVSPTRVQQWLDPAASDRTPVPMAILVELDGDDYARVVAAIDRARAER